MEPSTNLDEIKELILRLAKASEDPVPTIALALLTAQVTTIATSLEKITKLIYGNDKPGLLTIVTNNTRRLDSFEKVSWLFGGVAVTLTVGSVFYVVLYHGILH